MARAIKLLFLALPLWALLSPRAQAQTVNAASCNESDVQTALSSAGAGGQVNVPAGTCTWTSQLAVNKNVSIIGPGAGSLTIIDNAPSGNEMLLWTGTYGTTGCSTASSVCFRLSGMTIQPVTGSTTLFSPVGLLGTCASSGCPNIRVDDNTFSGWTEGGNGTQAEWIIRTDNIFGVIDHNHFTNTDYGEIMVNANLSAYLGVGSNGDNSWAQPDTFGSTNELYFESNTLDAGTSYDCDAPPNGGTMGGCRVVVRFNTFSDVNVGGAMQSHGTESGARHRGIRHAEVYGNTINCASSSGCTVSDAFLRSGTLLAFGNDITASNGGFYNSLVELLEYRVANAFSPWGTCDGTGGYDQNDGTVYSSGTASSGGPMTTLTDSTKNWTTNQWVSNGSPYSARDTAAGWGSEIDANTATTATLNQSAFSSPTWTAGDSYQILRATICIDQPGRGAGTYISGATPSPTGWVNEVLDPVYQWADIKNAAFYFPDVGSDTARIIANRDWYSQVSQSAQSSPTSPFNGTVGTGFGTLANRPPTCTTGVGYYATDQGSWNGSGNTFPGQSFDQGVLYVCAATNTWSTYYMPYTYPHPLVQGSGSSSGNPPAAPTNLTATVQ